MAEAPESLQERRIRLQRTEAIVLRRRDLGEADRILTLLTIDRGKVRAVAKGVRRPQSRLAGHLDLFVRSAVLLARGRELDVVTQAQLIEPYRGLREEPWRVGWAGYLADLTDRAIAEEEPQPFLYRTLAECLRELARAEDAFAVVRRYEMRLLVLLGYRPELYNCPVCGQRLRPGPVAYAADRGGVVCSDCIGVPGEIPLSIGAVKALRLLLEDRWELVAQRVRTLELRSQITAALQAALQHHLGESLASADVAAMLEKESSR